MGRLFGIVLFVLCLWFVAQQFVEVTPVAGGTGNSSATIPQQTREKVVNAHESGAERRRKLLGE